jgi:hypothetical protein
MQVERERGFGPEYSGARVSNTWVIYLLAGDNNSKGLLIPHTSTQVGKGGFGCHQKMSLRPIKLVGGVMAHQG